MSTAGGFDHKWSAMRSCSYHCPGGSRGGWARQISNCSSVLSRSVSRRMRRNLVRMRCRGQFESWVIILSPLHWEGVRKQWNRNAWRSSCNSRVAHFGVFPTNEFEGIHGYPIPSNFQPGETGLVRPHGHRSAWLGCALPLSKHDEGLGVKPKRGPWLANLKDLKIFIAKVNTQKLKGILKDHGGNSTKHQKQNTKNQETFEITSTLRLSGRVSRCHKSNSSIAPRHLCCMGWVLRVDGANWLMETEIESTNIVRLITKIDLQAILMQSIFGFHVRYARCFCRNAAALWFLNFVSIPHTGVV